MGNFSRLLNYRLDQGSVSHGTDWSKDGGGSSVGQTRVGQNGSIKQHLGVSFSLLPLSNDCFFSSSWSSKDGETMVGQGVGSVTSVGGGVGSVPSVGDGVGVGHRDGRRVVDQRSGGSQNSAGSSQDCGLSISRPLAVVTKVSESVVADSDRDGVGSHLVTHLGGSQHVRLHLGRMSDGTHWSQDGGGSGVGQTSSTQQLGVSL